MERDIHSIKEDVRIIRDALLAGKGGWKIVVSLLGLAGAIMVSVVTAWALNIMGPGGSK